MKSSVFPVTSVVEIFQAVSPWVYVRIPKEYTEMFQVLAERGLVPVTVTLGKTTWNTSLMPMGDGTQFIPLSKKVRKAEKVQLGNKIRLSFILRERRKISCS